MVANGWRVCYTRKNEGCRRQMACKEYTKGRAPNMKKDELIILREKLGDSLGYEL